MLNKLTTESFIIKAKLIHGDEYDYSGVNWNIIGDKNGHKKVLIKHKCGRSFEIRADSHLSGVGCKKCLSSLWNIFIDKARKIHGDRYEYNETDYKGCKIKMIMKHNKCGKSFEQTPDKHIQNHGCPYCKQSYLEKAVEKYLTENNIKYEIQKRFIYCKDKYPLPFDFYLPDKNILIECQGKQHYVLSTNLSYKSFSKDQALTNLNDRCKKDVIKRKYAKKMALN